MIYILHDNPKFNARYQSDEIIVACIKSVIGALYLSKGKWVKWTRKRSQNWRWMYRFLEALNEEVKRREMAENDLDPVLNWLWDHIPILPCSPRGRKSKYPGSKGISTRSFIYGQHKLFNQKYNSATWNKGTEEPFWYLGDID